MKVVQVGGGGRAVEEVAAGAAVTVGGASLSRSCFAKDGGEGKKEKKKAPSINFADITSIRGP